MVSGRWAYTGEAMLGFFAVLMAVAGGVWTAVTVIYGLSIHPEESWRAFWFYPVLDVLAGLGLLAVLGGVLVLRGRQGARPLALAACLLWLGAIVLYTFNFTSLSLDAYGDSKRLFSLGLFAAVFSSAALMILLRLKAMPGDGSSLFVAAFERLPGMLNLFIVVIIVSLFFFSMEGAGHLAGDLNFSSELKHAGVEPAQGYSLESLRRLIRNNPARAKPYKILYHYYLRRRLDLSAFLVSTVYDQRLEANGIERFFLEGPKPDKQVQSQSKRKAEHFKEETKLYFDRLVGVRGGIASLARDAAKGGRIRIVREFEPQTILGRPAAAGQGLLNLDHFDMRFACRYPNNCQEQFSSGNLQTAAGDGVAAILGPGNCCVLSLDDPDLREIDVAKVKAALAESPDLAEPVLAVLTRMLFKQLFLANFIASAQMGP